MGPTLAPAGNLADPEAVLVDIEEAHGGFVRPGLWRELSEFPEVLPAAWLAVRPLAELAAFQEARASILAAASEAVAGIEPPEPERLGLSAEAQRSIETILSWFTRGIAAMIVEIEYLRRVSREAGMSAHEQGESIEG
jgi:hypothetical protein